ncbi:hypothetical protein ACFLXN_00120 [Chloroflexota bacterium]
MTKEKLLTVRANNWLTLIFGLPTMAYGVVGLTTSALAGFWGFLGLFIIGAVY